MLTLFVTVCQTVLTCIKVLLKFKTFCGGQNFPLKARYSGLHIANNYCIVTTLGYQYKIYILNLNDIIMKVVCKNLFGLKC